MLLMKEKQLLAVQ